MGFTLGRWNIHSTKKGGKSRLRVIRPYVCIYILSYTGIASIITLS